MRVACLTLIAVLAVAGAGVLRVNGVDVSRPSRQDVPRLLQRPVYTNAAAMVRRVRHEVFGLLYGADERTVAALNAFRPPRYPAFAGATAPAIPFRDGLVMVHAQS